MRRQHPFTGQPRECDDARRADERFCACGVIGEIGCTLLDTCTQALLHQIDNRGVPMCTAARRHALVHCVSDQRMPEPIPALCSCRHGLDDQPLERFVKRAQQIGLAPRLNDRCSDAEVELAAHHGPDGEQLKGRLRQAAQASLQNGANVIRYHVAIRRLKVRNLGDEERIAAGPGVDPADEFVRTGGAGDVCQQLSCLRQSEPCQDHLLQTDARELSHRLHQAR